MGDQWDPARFMDTARLEGGEHVDVFALPIVTRSEPNERGFWWTKEKRRKHHLFATSAAVRAFFPRHRRLAVVRVRFFRYSNRLLDTDNLAASFKYVRDGVAEALESGDGPRGRVTWEYDQVLTHGRRGTLVELYLDPALLPQDPGQATKSQHNPENQSDIGQLGVGFPSVHTSSTAGAERHIPQRTETADADQHVEHETAGVESASGDRASEGEAEQ